MLNDAIGIRDNVRMKIPSYLAIFENVSYDILYSDSDDYFGWTVDSKDEPRKIIVLNRNIPDDVLIKTLFHEVLHVWNVEGDFGLTHKQIYSLEEAMHEFFSRNGLMEFLIKGFEREAERELDETRATRIKKNKAKKKTLKKKKK